MSGSYSTAHAKVIALCGNPNVGKSTLFNALTGLKQHTGNWTGKTVETARGSFECCGRQCELVDLPGCYSLNASSPEEEAARSFIMSGEADCTVIVCDASCPERGLFFALQVLELTRRAVLCLNFCGYAARRGIRPDTDALAKLLGIRVVTLDKAKRSELDPLLNAIEETVSECPADASGCACAVDAKRCAGRCADCIAENIVGHSTENRLFGEYGIYNSRMGDLSHEDERCARTNALWRAAESIAHTAVERDKDTVSALRLKADRLLTGRVTGRLASLLLLAAVLYLTISGANYPSSLLAGALGRLLELARSLLGSLLPERAVSAICDGVLQTLFTVISVMLPPMAIFFPLFTLLEDAGLLPRIAFDLDAPFMRCRSCGKQALTMCMGLGCNAVGVTGCRIIGSRRERLLAIITNSLVPCNGRFPALITLCALFASMNAVGGHTALTVVMMLGLMLLSFGMTLLADLVLSHSVLRGERRAFLLELPPYRRPRIGQVISRSLIDRTAKVLARALKVAAPAGLLIWVLNDTGLMPRMTHVLDPIGKALGIDGGILLAFVLGLPANELILPLTLMTGGGGISALSGGVGYGAIAGLAAANGWTEQTVLCMTMLMLFHSPCAPTLLTIRRETGSAKWTLAAFILPCAIGCALCIAISLISML